MGDLNNNIPFAFWLVKNFLSAEEEQAEESTPISNNEFYLSMVLIAVAFSLFSLFIKGCTF